MLPPNPLLQLTPLRVQRAVARIQESIWSNPRPAAVEVTAPRTDHLQFAEAVRLPRRRWPGQDFWGRLYDQRWSRVEIPAGGGRWLRWDEQGEATLHVAGRPFYGFDVAHRLCEIPRRVREVWVESICMQAAIWHPDAKGLDPRGNRFDGATLLERDDEAWDAYHDLNCLLEVLLDLRSREHPQVSPVLNPQTTQPAVNDASPRYRRLLRHLDEALDAFERDGIPALRRALADIYRDLRSDRPLVHAVLTGHSHIDLVWLWPERIGVAKTVHTFANVDRLLALYPEFRFACSQPACYEAAARRSPALGRIVRAHLRAGGWEATGGLYVESDSNLPCGEGLARSFLLGQAAFVKLTGRRSRLAWLPDLFGFNACLPQLMRLSGVDYFFTTKTTWNAVNRFPHSSFIWRGAGGAEVVSHVTQNIQFNNTVSVAQLRDAARGHAQSDIHPEFLMPNGWGDGGGGPSEDMCERARRLGALGDLPGAAWGHPEAFFDRLAERRHLLPAHDGEIYLEYHRGTATTQGRVKEVFRTLERALQLREAAAVATRTAPDLTAVWKRMVFTQFHDWIPGSSIPDVYAEGLPEMTALAQAQTAAARTALSSRGGDSCIFNPLPLCRRYARAGKVLELPPLAGVRVADAVVHDLPPVVTKRLTLSNGRVTARITRRGSLDSLEIDGGTVALERGACDLMCHPDQPANFDAWEIDRHTLSLGQPVRGAVSVRAEDNAIVVERKVGRSSTATVRYALDPGSAVLRIEVGLDWHEEQTLLKMRFPTAYRGREACFGTPFGSVLRPQLATSPQAAAMWEVPASRWAAVSDDGGRAGLFVVTEAKYGFGCHHGELTLSLVRSPLHVGFDSHAPAYPHELGRLRAPRSRFTDQGRHTIHLALGRFDIGAPRDQQPAALADTLFTEPVVYRGQPVATAFRGLEGADTLIPTWAMPLDGRRWTLRMNEVHGLRGTTRVLLAPGWTARKTNLLDEPLGEPLRDGVLEFAPYEIVSLRIEPA
jgi:alpha-mannosidase